MIEYEEPLYRFSGRNACGVDTDVGLMMEHTSGPAFEKCYCSGRLSGAHSECGGCEETIDCPARPDPGPRRTCHLPDGGDSGQGSFFSLNLSLPFCCCK